MSDTPLEERLAACGLKIADGEKPPQAELAAEKDCAATGFRSLERTYFDAPSRVLRLAPGA